MSIRVFQRATHQQLTGLNVPSTAAFLDDLGSSKKTAAPITAGLFRMGKGEPILYTYEFDEFELVLEGEITATEEGGEVHGLKSGDLIRFSVGS